MRKYCVLGHIECVSKSEDTFSSICYFAHHAIVRKPCTTTKLRVVFDSSAKSISGASLNTILMVSPRIQQELLQILLTFKTMPIVVCVNTMYR